MSPITVELHCHSYSSKDSLMLPARLLEVCHEKGIDKLAITDHNTTTGAKHIAMLDPDRVIIGQEINTTQGELLAYFVQAQVQPGLTPKETIAILRDQGAFISVSHPLDSIRSGSWQERELQTILPLVDALEVFNARTIYQIHDRRAVTLATEAGLLGTAGSDAHAYSEVGKVVMRMPDFEDASGMHIALAEAEIIGNRSSPLVHFFSRYAAWRKRLGWQPPQL